MSKNFNYNKQYKAQREPKPEPEKVEEPEVSKSEEKFPDKYVVISEPPLNFREFASIDAEVRKLLKKGDELTMIQNLGEWSEVQFGDMVGYVMTKFIKKV